MQRAAEGAQVPRGLLTRLERRLFRASGLRVGGWLQVLPPHPPPTPAEIVGKGVSRCRGVEWGGCLARGPEEVRALAFGKQGLTEPLKAGKGFGIYSK